MGDCLSKIMAMELTHIRRVVIIVDYYLKQFNGLILGLMDFYIFLKKCCFRSSFLTVLFNTQKWSSLEMNYF
jgi:hypothetical protein